jgi:hypothetical protein
MSQLEDESVTVFTQYLFETKFNVRLTLADGYGWV